MATNSVLAKMAVQISANTADFNRSLSATQKSISSFQKSVSAVSKAVAGLYIADRLVDFGRQVFNVTAEFQKFEAVLTNTLGDKGAAGAAMDRIVEFATKTPFQVAELTSSFVKLANQGFIPTLNQMQSLGDLASAMGKSFDQLTEAIIDAQTGEFERLKEFGIRAKKQGDQVTFTFKGVKTQVDFTADSIRQYILSLGQAEGVTGGMEAVSKTLGGQLSNLNDIWDQFMLSLGKGTAGPIGGALIGLTKLVEAITPVDARSREGVESRLAALQEERLKAAQDNDVHRLFKIEQAIVSVTKELNKYIDAEKKLDEITANKSTPAVKEQTQSLKELMDQWDRQNSIFSKKFDPADQIKSKTGADFLFDSGALTEMANAGANALRTLDKALEVNSTSWDVWWEGVQARAQQVAEIMAAHQERTALLAEVSQTVGVAMGEAFSSLATGQENLLQAMARATEQIISMFLQQSIAGMIAAAMKDPSTPFPFAKIAIAAAGVAAVKGLFSSLGGNGGGGSGGRSSAPGRTPSEVGVKVGGRIRGYDLAIVNDKESYRRSRLG